MLKEEYFTDPSVAKELIQYAKQKEGLFKLYIEPSAGTGNFLKYLPKNKTIAFDINPRFKNIKKQDFLKWKYNGKISREDIACIGNPPFGMNSNLAKKFIKKCAEFSDHIFFILPISFKSKSYEASIPKTFRKIWSLNLPLNIFIDKDGYEFDQPIKTMFVYYKNTYKPRAKRKTPQPNKYWKYTKDPHSAHIRIVRASGTPGRAFHDFDPYKKTSYYYIVLTNKSKIKKITKKINNYKKWKFNNVSTFKSIDKPQMTTVLNKFTEKR